MARSLTAYFRWSRGCLRTGKKKLGLAEFLRYAHFDMKSKPSASLPILQKGQLWKTKTARIEIMYMGKLLAHYRYFVDGRTRVSTTMARVRMIQDYLNANGAKLIKNERLNVST
jgi:hypothetical protein